MSQAPLYQELQQSPVTSCPAGGHKGLWFDRFFNQYTSGWEVTKADPQGNIEEGKKHWINTVVGSCGDKQQLEAACQGLKSLCCKALHGQSVVLETTWHFATGLGNPHPVENGFAWHPTLGVPYLTGQAVKGLVRAWVEAGWMEFEGTNEVEKNTKRLNTLYRWFGSEDVVPAKRAQLRKAGFHPPTKGKNLDTETGMFSFFDAIPVAPVQLACDVMTPHYGQWYENGGEIRNIDQQPELVPADWHSPVPIPFLVVKKASLMFCIAPRIKPAENDRANVEEELGQVKQALVDALQYLGAGAKTAVGYGHLKIDEESEKKQEQASFREKLEGLPTAERMRQEILQLTPDKIAKMFGKDYTSTIENIKKKYNLNDYVKIIFQEHAEEIKEWEKSQDKNKKKAFSKLKTVIS